MSTRSRPTSPAAPRPSPSRATRVGYRLSLRLHPETDVQQVYDAFDTGADEHFLGGGERGDSGRPPRPDPPDQGRLHVHLRRGAVLRELGRLGRHGSRRAARVGARVPRLARRRRLPARRAPRAASRRSRAAPRCACRARGSTRSSTPARSRETLKAYEAQAGRPRVPPPSELELIKWRDVASGPAEVLEDVDAPAGGGDPDRLGAARQPVGDVQRDAHVRPLTHPRPGRADPTGARARRPLHALGLAEGDLRRRLSRREPSSARSRAGRSTCASRPSFASTRRGCASSSRSGSTASRATAATRSSWRRSARRCRTSIRCSSRGR